MGEMDVGHRFKNMSFLAHVCVGGCGWGVCVCVFCLRQLFSLLESGKHADYKVIDLEEE